MISTKKVWKAYARFLRGWRSFGQGLICLLVLATFPISLPFILLITLRDLSILKKSSKHLRRASAYYEASKRIIESEEWKNGTDETLQRDIVFVKHLHEKIDYETNLSKAITRGL